MERKKVNERQRILFFFAFLDLRLVFHGIL